MVEISSQECQIFGVGDSLQGGRPENQDDFDSVHTPLGFLVVLCDGMGGGPGGKTASYLSKMVFIQSLSNSMPSVSSAVAIRKAVFAAEEALENRMKEDPSLVGMGSTLAAILFDKKRAFVVHLGDSRVYQLRGKKMVFRTKDHSLVQELQDRKAMTEEQARISPQSNVIMRGLGNTTNHVAEIEEIQYRSGDRFVLCSDGVWGSMPHGDILDRLTRQNPASLVVGQLQSEIDQIGYAAGGGHDNHTIIMLDVRGNVKSSYRSWLPQFPPRTLLLILLVVLLLISIVMNIFLVVRTDGKKLLSDNWDRSSFGQTALADNLTSQRSSESVVIEVLNKNLDSLSKSTVFLQMTIDSLQNEIASLSARRHKQIHSTQLVVGPSARLDEALNLLNKMGRNYDHVEAKIQNANRNRFDEVVILLNQFKTQTSPLFDGYIENLVADMSADKDSMTLSMQLDPEKKYKASESAKTIIGGYKEKVKTLKKEYLDINGNNNNPR